MTERAAPRGRPCNAEARSDVREWAFARWVVPEIGVLLRVATMESSSLLERRMSVSEPRRWKPTPEAYRFAAQVCGGPIAQMALVAVHPWDVDGPTVRG